jgi:hypothetical protein
MPKIIEMNILPKGWCNNRLKFMFQAIHNIHIIWNPYNLEPIFESSSGLRSSHSDVVLLSKKLNNFFLGW